MTLDPFRAVTKPGKIAAGIANRVLIIAELGLAALAIYYQHTENFFGGTGMAIFMGIVYFLAVLIVNWILKMLCNALLILIHGTTDLSKAERDLAQRDADSRRQKADAERQDRALRAIEKSGEQQQQPYRPYRPYGYYRYYQPYRKKGSKTKAKTSKTSKTKSNSTNDAR